MKRYQKIATKIISALLMSGFLLLAACDQELDFWPPEDERTKENATQGSKPTPQEPDGKPGPSPVTPSGPSTTPENTPPSTDGTSSNTPGTTTPSAGGDADSTVTGDSTAEQKVAPWSDPEDYEYYSKLPFKNKEYESIKNLMRQQIVPQAVEALLRTFPKTFGYLRDWAVGFGLNVTYNEFREDTEAYFSASLAVNPDADKASSIAYALMINMASPYFVLEKDELDDEKRRRLEVVCVHELMHAMMYETLTCGMTGYSSEDQKVEEFPTWFKEGTAEAACGGRLWKNLIQVDESQQKYTVEKIKETLVRQTLTANNTTSQYTVGWFAVMYLAYLSDGTGAVDPVSLARGLDSILLEIHKGTSLSEAIRIHSKNKYSDLQDFQDKFASQDEVADFVLRLITEIGAGSGSLVGGSFADTDLLRDEDHKLMPFWIYTESDQYTNKYGNALNVEELLVGGAATHKGVPGANFREFSPTVLPTY